MGIYIYMGNERETMALLEETLFEKCVGSEKSPRFLPRGGDSLTAEAVQGAALALQSVDDVHGRHSLALGVLGVGHGITDDVLEEHLQDTTGLLVDQAGDSLDTTTASQTADSGLGDTLDVITQHLAMTLGAPLSKTLASLAASRHLCSSAEILRIWQSKARSAFISD